MGCGRLGASLGGGGGGARCWTRSSLPCSCRRRLWACPQWRPRSLQPTDGQTPCSCIWLQTWRRCFVPSADWRYGFSDRALRRASGGRRLCGGASVAQPRRADDHEPLTRASPPRGSLTSPGPRPTLITARPTLGGRFSSSPPPDPACGTARTAGQLEPFALQATWPDREPEPRSAESQADVRACRDGSRRTGAAAAATRHV